MPCFYFYFTINVAFKEINTYGVNFCLNRRFGWLVWLVYEVNNLLPKKQSFLEATLLVCARAHLWCAKVFPLRALYKASLCNRSFFRSFFFEAFFSKLFFRSFFFQKKRPLHLCTHLARAHLWCAKVTVTTYKASLCTCTCGPKKATPSPLHFSPTGNK